MAEILDVAGQHRCAHVPCRCQVPLTEKYCGIYCSEAAKDKEIEIQCDCKHPACALD